MAPAELFVLMEPLERERTGLSQDDAAELQEFLEERGEWPPKDRG